MFLPAVRPVAAAQLVILWAALLVVAWGAPAGAVESAEAALWAGEWNAGVTPPDDDQVREVSSYDILTNAPVTPAGFSYVNAYNDVGDGPNAQTRMEGQALFESATRAVDREHGIAFSLEVAPEDGIKSITAARLADAKAAPLVFSQRATYRAGFDCMKAGSMLERMICRSRVLARADLELGELYQAVREKLTPPEQAQLTAAQRAWLKDRDARCVKAGKGDGRCLGLAYAHRLAALKKLADPNLGRVPRFDAAYVLAQSRKSPDLWTDTAFDAALYSLALGPQLEMYRPHLTTAGDAAESRTGGTFSYRTLISPADGQVTVSFLIVVQASGDLWIAYRETSDPESQDYDGRIHVIAPRERLPRSSWPAAIANWGGG